MKKIYIPAWLSLTVILVVGVGATALILHTITLVNFEYLAYKGN